MKRILILTAHTGYNYGTYLQAYAMKCFMKQFADSSEIVWEKSFGPKGRDYRLKKFLLIGVRSLLHYKHFSSIKQGYMKNFAAEPSDNTKLLFDEFSHEYLNVKEVNYRYLKKYAMSSETIAVVCGSDQIWNASSMYPDPLYYLQFAPIEKRIAYAPSFGRNQIPSYNKKIIRKYLKSIPSISVRESSGEDIVQQLIGKKVPIMPDPTLIIDWNNWISQEKENYILLYFLDEPDSKVLKEIDSIQKKKGMSIKILLHEFESFKSLKNYDVIDAGPKEFVEAVSKASFVCTDSFHATIFSILSSTSFYVYERNYGKVANQSCRINSLLEHYNMQDRLRKNTKLNFESLDCSFEEIEKIRKKDICNAREYMNFSLYGDK